jgi:hypothetical protein
MLDQVTVLVEPQEDGGGKDILDAGELEQHARGWHLLGALDAKPDATVVVAAAADEHHEAPTETARAPVLPTPQVASSLPTPSDPSPSPRRCFYWRGCKGFANLG